MSGDDAMKQAITDARALLETLVSSGWQDMHVVSGDTEIFIAQAGGQANPMRYAPEPAASPTVQTDVVPHVNVTVQHVATLVDVLPVGTVVQTGQKIATIRVLQDEEAVLAPVSGQVTQTPADIGALVEYGKTILLIAEAM